MKLVVRVESSLTVLYASGYGGTMLASSLVTLFGDNSSTMYDGDTVTGISILLVWLFRKKG